MSYKTNLASILVLLLVVLTAAQCGAASERPGQSAPEASVSSLAEDEHEEAQSSDEEIATAPEMLAAISLEGGEKMKVVATTTIVGDLVRNVAGDLIDLTILLPAGSDPHAFSPTPRDIAAVADAHVIFINGFGLEEFLRELLDNAGGEAAVIALSEGVEPREFAENDEAEPSEAEDHEEAGHLHSGLDPHTFMTAANALIFVDNVKQALNALDPANADTYETNAGAYKAQLTELEQWIQAEISTIPPENRRMVTDHDSFGYYAGHYGLEVVGAVIPGYSTGAEPSARELAQLQDTITDYNVKAVFVGTTVNPAIAQRLAEDSGIQMVPLYSDSLGLAGSGAETYLDYMRYNTKAIVAALKP